MKRGLLAFCAIALAAIAFQVGPASAGAHPPAAARTWVGTIDNPYYPLIPGSSWVYKGIKDGKSQTDRVQVLSDTKVVDGVTTTIVRDVAKHKSTLLERTFDWYAQDSDGNVWYYGEDTAAYGPGGTIDTEGSWESGVDGAVPGIIMEADPQVADGYRQEYYARHAEDQAWVESITSRINVPYGAFDHVLRSLEWTPLEPDVYTLKFYAPGVGIVREVDITGGVEYANLKQATLT